MPKGFKAGGRDFQKGHAPYIRKPGDPEVKRIRIEGKEAVARLYWDLVNLDLQGVEDKLKDRTNTVFEHAILRAIASDMKKGTVTTLEKLMDRVLGKAKEYINLGGTIKTESTVDVTKLTFAEKRAMLEIMQKAQVDANASDI